MSRSGVAAQLRDGFSDVSSALGSSVRQRPTMSVHEDSAVDLGDLFVVVPGISKQISCVTNIAKSEVLEPAKCDDRESIVRINEVDVIEV